MKRLPGILLLLLLCAIGWLGWTALMPVSLPDAGYRLLVGPNRTMKQIARTLGEDGAVRSPQLLVALARLSGSDRKIKAGLYRFQGPQSLLDVLQRLREGRPDEASLTTIEGWTFRQFRQAIDRSPDLSHDAQKLSDAELMSKLGLPGADPEGLFFPSTYLFTPGASDMDLYRLSFEKMQQQLAAAWESRKPNLPYRTPYEMLIMASLIEKETANELDRPMVASVFVNRLKLGMRLQTDPSVIYGMGDRYQGNIGKADLRRDTPYNTYTRAGLTPTPISLPSRAALYAAAQPAESTALYFVARGDGSSQFSSTLEEHNQAVRKYILKKGKQ
ncbi:endolytic transglycosylase MltG [Chromobacterium amazonense]|uniref:Endolytic murein transglycosylase n=1 Tax=Chromobacterium amazonense TaxID=1382803 RepID=A0A1S1X9X5_9NEIS|nr:endolytic transglycosylase MltG [Chromobacterium amazonense]MBM2884992.1 endolytic transglycosylase MltG [Chromobacterium amazonense]MDE1714648.1 endolytic transglycosylase MltG [Chromobacterium amazonense]MDQ4540419.1 endolytic transglycosylase MltG [Chromobacterium amazonense]OHX16582.1 aminodeoxychorismate lyase [Chromobacterium amazonense]PRP69459.1 aminodeoxychorismate lyase [Chromobacterium amazonense]